MNNPEYSLLTNQFKKWASLMDTVYPVNSAGKYAAVYALMSVFHKEITAVDHCFPSMFISAPCGSSKTSIANSIFNFHQNKVIINASETDLFMQVIFNYGLPVIIDEYYKGSSSSTIIESAMNNELNFVTPPLLVLSTDADFKSINPLMCLELPKLKNIKAESLEDFRLLKNIESEGFDALRSYLLSLKPMVSLYYEFEYHVARHVRDLKHLSSTGNNALMFKTAIHLITIFKLFVDFFPASYQHFDQLVYANLSSIYVETFKQ